MIEACKYVQHRHAPMRAPHYHGHFADAEVRELGVPLVTGDIPGFVVMIGPAPSAEEAVETIKGYQSRGIFVFLIGGIIEQAVEAGLSMGFPVRVVPVGEEIWSVGHVISLVVRAADDLRRRPARRLRRLPSSYTFDRINAFVNAYKPVQRHHRRLRRRRHQAGLPGHHQRHTTICGQFRSPSSSTTDTKDWIDTSIEARGIKLKITKIDIPVSFSSAFEGEIIRKGDMQIEVDGSRKDCFELVSTKDASEVEDHKIERRSAPRSTSSRSGSKISLSYTVEVAGKTMQPDFEPVFERKIHQLPQLRGRRYAHRSARHDPYPYQQG